MEALLRALTADANLQFRCPTGLRIGVVSLAGNDKSRALAQQTLAEITAGQLKELKSLSVSAELIEISDPAELWEKVDQKELNVLFLCPSLEKVLAQILKFSRIKKILLLTGEPEYVWAGASLGAVQRDGKPHYLVHLEAATEQGAKFAEGFLKRAELVSLAPKYQSPEAFKRRRIAGRDPEFPSMARSAKLEASIVVKVFISPGGEVGKIQFLRTNQYFEQAVREAIESWKFSPFLVDGRPLGTFTVFTFSFKL